MKHYRYLRYVLRHKWFVFRECVRLGIPWRGAMHDMSKFLPSEWFPYGEWFYGPAGKRAEESFNISWLKHQHRNPHHWQYWVLREDNPSGDAPVVIDMPVCYRKEMVADWIGAGKAIHGKNDVTEWYARNRHNIILHPCTRAWIEGFIGFKDE